MRAEICIGIGLRACYLTGASGLDLQSIDMHLRKNRGLYLRSI